MSPNQAAPDHNRRVKNVPGWARTTDLQIRNLLLYPTELPGHIDMRMSAAIWSTVNEIIQKFRILRTNFLAWNTHFGDKIMTVGNGGLPLIRASPFALSAEGVSRGCEIQIQKWR